MRTPFLPEATRRRPDFAEGVPLAWPDGTTWHLRLPALLVRPRIEGGRPVAVVVGREGLPDYDRLASILLGLERVEPTPYWHARFEAATALLRTNYDLADDELQQLLEHTVGDEASAARWRTIEDVFLGRLPDPKREAGGSSSD